MLRFLMPLCAVLACGLAASVDNCRLGESYWCSSLDNAKSCGAMAHCQSTVWKNQLLKEDDSEVCSFCQTIVTDVANFVRDNRTQQEILRFFTNACQMVPIKSVAAECQRLTEQFLPEIIDLVVSEVSPKSICGLLKMCTSFEDTVIRSQQPAATVGSRVNVLTKYSPLPVNSEPLCSDCKTLFTDIKNIIVSNATEQEIELLIDQGLCTHLGTFENQCKDMVKAYLPEIISLLATELDPNMICQTLGFCNQTMHEAKNFLLNLKLKKSDFYKKASVESSAAGCEICKDIMKDIQDIDRDRTVQASIENFLKNDICSHFGSYKIACEGMIDVYGPLLFQLLANELDPASRCQSLGFCAAGNEIKETTPAQTTPVSSKPVPVAVTPQCILCEFVMREIDGLLSKNATKEEIIAALDKVCSILPSTLKSTCDDFVKNYGEAILDMLIQELDPSVICSTLGLCAQSERNIPVALPEGIKCLICETSIHYLDALLEENSTIAHIEEAMQKVCNFIPEKMRAGCDFVIQTYGPEIIQYIAMDLTPKTVCEMIHACPTLMVRPDVSLKTEAKVVEETHKRLGDAKCAWGPQHWCASRDNAKACQATAYCEENGWEF